MAGFVAVKSGLQCSKLCTISRITDFANWILLGDQFVNRMQKTGPKSDIFHGFWDLLKIWWKMRFLNVYEKVCVSVTNRSLTPHPSLVQIRSEKRSKIYEKYPIYMQPLQWTINTVRDSVGNYYWKFHTRMGAPNYSNFLCSRWEFTLLPYYLGTTVSW